MPVCQSVLKQIYLRCQIVRLNGLRIRLQIRDTSGLINREYDQDYPVSAGQGCTGAVPFLRTDEIVYLRYPSILGAQFPPFH